MTPQLATSHLGGRGFRGDGGRPTTGSHTRRTTCWPTCLRAGTEIWEGGGAAAYYTCPSRRVRQQPGAAPLSGLQALSVMRSCDWTLPKPGRLGTTWQAAVNGAKRGGPRWARAKRDERPRPPDGRAEQAKGRGKQGPSPGAVVRPGSARGSRGGGGSSMPHPAVKKLPLVATPVLDTFHTHMTFTVVFCKVAWCQGPPGRRLQATHGTWGAIVVLDFTHPALPSLCGRY